MAKKTKVKITQKNIEQASQALVKLSEDAECASTTLHRVVKRGNNLVNKFPINTAKIEELRRIEDKIGVVTNIAKFFKQGQEEKFFSTAIPVILEQSGFDKSTRIHRAATSNIAGKTASFLKPAALSILSYYVRKHKKLIPDQNPLQLKEYPSLFDNNTSSSDKAPYTIYQQSSDSQDRSCMANSKIISECLDISAKQCDKQTSKITEPIEDNLIGCINNKAQQHILSNEEYNNLREVLLSSGGIKKLYNNIFPKQRNATKHDVKDLKSSTDLEQYVESQFKSKSRFQITRNNKTHSVR